MTTIKCDSLGCRFNEDGFCGKDKIQILTEEINDEIMAYCRDKNYQSIPSKRTEEEIKEEEERFEEAEEDGTE